MSKNLYFPLVEVEGSNYEIGYQIGKRFEDRIKRCINQSSKITDLIAHAKEKPQIKDQVESIVKYQYPQYIKEIEGIADGARVPYESILIMNFRAIPQKDDINDNCSTMIYKNKDEIILGHNEDFDSIIGSNSYIIKARLDSGLMFLSHAYPGILPGTSFGFNSNGIVYSVNNLTPPTNMIGVPRHFLGRSLLEGESLNDAISRAFPSPPVSGGASYNVASLNEKIIANLETSSEDSSITNIENRYFHTNHYISKKFLDYPIPKFSTSLVRYKRGIQLIESSERTASGVLNSLIDKYIFVKSLKNNDGTINMTLCTAIFTLSDKIHLDIYPREDHLIQSFSTGDLE